MRDDFCAFILSHGRPDRVHTYKTLMKSGYTGKVYIVIDDEDETADEYRERFGDKVLQFCKKDVAERIDEGDNFEDRRVIIYARNVCWDLAKQVGCRYFIQLDDDYKNFRYRFDSIGVPGSFNIRKTLNDLILSCLELLCVSSHISSVALAQGGDMSSLTKTRYMRRKCMNSFLCDSHKSFLFFGRINEDVNTYVTLSRRGNIFFTVMSAQLDQLPTQSNKGGMTDIYLDAGTYLKAFYTVMYAPSCAKVGTMGDPRNRYKYRIHHKINWNVTAPKILREERKKCRGLERMSTAFPNLDIHKAPK